MYLDSRCHGVVAALLLASGLITPHFTLHAQEAEPSGQPTGGAASRPTTATDNLIARSVVKVFSTMRAPNPYKPWQKGAPSESTGSGVVIEGKRILSNAHVVLYASQVLVQANQAGEKIPAKVVAVAPGIDLAVLELDDETFFETHPPLPRAKTLPALQDTVLAYGYPMGGDSLSITKGIVSRIEFAPYHYPVAGMRIQIDAAINPGNSGGAAVVGDKMIGLAFSYLGGSQKIGYIIPCEEIELFLQDIADGHYDGKPAIFDDYQTLENPALYPFLKLDKSVHGMVVRKPDSKEADYPLKAWDVISKIDNTPVDDEGMVKLEDNLRVRFSYLVQKTARHGTVPLTVVRAGKELQIELPVSQRREQLLMGLEGAYPSYFVWGPMVFSTATREFVSGLMQEGSSWAGSLIAMGSPLIKRFGEKPAFKGEQLVVVSSPFFPHKLAKGYSSPAYQVVQAINGIPIKNLVHLVAVLRDCKEKFVTIEFDSIYGETLVFPRAEMLAATDEILADNGIRLQGSADTLEVWNAKAVP